MPAHSTVTAAQAWSVLSRHARDEISRLRLQELCRDNDRSSSLVAVYNTTSEPSSLVDDQQQQQQATTENRMLIVDLSRQRMTLETLTHLLKLATAKNLRQWITQLAWGQNDPRQPILPTRAQQRNNKGKTRAPTPHYKKDDRKTARFVEAERPGIIPSSATFDTTTTTTELPRYCPSMHMALRVPSGNKNYEMLTADGTNALTQIHREWERIHLLSDSIRHGQLRGVSGSMIRNVLVIGQGVPLAALQFVSTALLHDERAVWASRLGLPAEAPVAARILQRRTASREARRLQILTRVDPVAAAAVVADLDPASTLVISIALNGNEETGLATKTLKSWLLQALGQNRRPDHVLAKHMMLVTGNDHIASVINKPESVHIIPDHSRCEAFSTFSAAALLVRAVGLLPFSQRCLFLTLSLCSLSLLFMDGLL